MPKIYVNPPRSEWPALTARCTRQEEEIGERVAAILAEVRTGGDAALRRIVRRIEGYLPETFEVTRERRAEAAKAVSPQLKAALEQAKANIEAFHRAQLPAQVEVETMPGVRCVQRAVAIGRAGLYIPGGKAPGTQCFQGWKPRCPRYNREHCIVKRYLQGRTFPAFSKFLCHAGHSGNSGAANRHFPAFRDSCKRFHCQWHDARTSGNPQSTWQKMCCRHSETCI